jgi:mannosyltransferase
MLAGAILAGGLLRFVDLGGNEMSADEGASWAAASAPTVGDVLSVQIHLNPGKAGLHDVLLHFWIGAFGDGLAAMRTLSAIAGTIAIALVFAVTRELLAVEVDSAGDAAFSAGQRDCAAACAAMFFAVNLVTIKYAREVRMYPIEIAAVQAQIFFLLRAVRCGGPGNFAGVALFTPLALAAHLTAVLVLASEGLWLAYVGIRWRETFAVAASASRRAIELFGAIGVGAAMLAPLAPAVLRSTAHAAGIGAIDWIQRPALWAPIAMFNKATGSFAFPVFAALAVWGAICGWRRARAGAVFAILWMWAPAIMLLAISYAVRPVFVERYAVTSFTPFFILAAIGIVELPLASVRIPASVIAVALALGHAGVWAGKPHDTQWREGVRIATANVTGGRTIAVAPGYAVNVVHYYLREPPVTGLAHPMAVEGADLASVGIIGEQGVTPSFFAAIEREYPHKLANLRGVVVRGR